MRKSAGGSTEVAPSGSARSLVVAHGALGKAELPIQCLEGL